MKLIDKLKIVKEEMVENISENMEISKLSANELATRYGASTEKFLNVIRKLYLINYDEQNPDLIQFDLEYVSDKDEKITFLNSYFGDKEKFDLKLLKTIALKDDFKVELLTNDNNQKFMHFSKYPFNYVKKSTIGEKVSETLSKDNIIKTATDIKDATFNGTKKVLHKLSDLADKYLN